MTKKEISEIKKLQQKKQRLLQQLFVVEGMKAIEEVLHAGIRVKKLFYTDDVPPFVATAVEQLEQLEEGQMEKVSFLQTPTSYLALAELPAPNQLALNPNELTLALDNIQDPGNLGTIIRLADWFGVKTIICSPTTADCYNPKVVQATMGAIGRISIVYTDLEPVLASAKQSGIPTYGTFMNGDNIYTSALSANGILVMGNEGKGISPSVETSITQRITIPSFKDDKVESLNVAIATAICCSELKRRSL